MRNHPVRRQQPVAVPRCGAVGASMVTLSPRQSDHPHRWRGNVMLKRWRGNVMLKRTLKHLTVLLLLTAVLAPASANAQATAPCTGTLTWTGIVPDCLSPGASYRILFVTSDTRLADSSAIGDYNTFVQAQADGVTGTPFSGITFNALGSTNSISARDNTETNPNTDGTGERIFYYLGEQVADDYADLYDSLWDSINPRDQTGRLSPTENFFGSNVVRVYTGSNSDGTPHGFRLGNPNSSVGLATSNSAISGTLDGNTFGFPADALSFYALSTVLTAPGATSVNVCDRTTQVEDAILAALTPTPACTSVSAGELATITTLDLRNMGIDMLTSSDFAGLSALVELNLFNNNLNTLPVGVFAGLTSVQRLYINTNQLTSLHADIFDGLDALVDLGLADNPFTPGTGLPAGIFDDVLNTLGPVATGGGTGLAVDTVGRAAHFVCSHDDANAIVAATPGTPHCLRITTTQFNEALQRMDATLSGLTLTAGTLEPTFDSGTTSYTASVANSVTRVTVTPTAGSNSALVRVNGTIAVATIDLELPGTATPITIVVTAATNAMMTYTVDVTRAAVPAAALAGTLTEANLFAATAPTVTVTLTNTEYAAAGTLAETHFTVTDTVAGSVSVSGFTRDSNTAATLMLAYSREDITANGTLSVALAADGHTADGALTTNTIPITASTGTNVCGRTAQVRDAIIAGSTATECTSITDLATITTIDVSGQLFSTLQSGDFAGLTGLQSLSLDGNILSALPATIFAGLSALQNLNLSGNALRILPANIFVGLTALRDLNLSINSLETLDAGLFNGLGLTSLALNTNDFTAGTGLPAGIFDPVLGTLGDIGDSFFVDQGVRDAHFVCSRPDFATIVAATAGVEDCLRISAAQFNAAILQVDATLSGLTLSDGDLDPVFASGTTAYAVSVANSVESVTVMPTATNAADATISVNGNTVISGNASTAVSLTPGMPMDIPIIVTAADTSTTMTYTVTATRAMAATTTPAATLAGTLTEATLFASSAPTVTVTLANTEYAAAGTLLQTHFTVTDDVTGTVSVSGFNRDSNTAATLMLAYSREDITANGTLSVALAADGHTADGALTTNTIPITASTGTNVCGRTAQVQTAILAMSSATECTSVGDLATIGQLRIDSMSIMALRSGDFAGLTGMTNLRINFNSLTTLPADIFDGLSALSSLLLNNNQLGSLDPDIFDGLSALRSLRLDNNLLTTLHPDIFDGLDMLVNLNLLVNDFTADTGLPEGIFDDVLNTLGAINESRFGSGFMIDDTVRDAHFVCSRTDADAIVAATSGVSHCLRITSAQFDAYNLADATLSGLTLSDGTLDPAFASGTTAYAVSVDNGVASVTVTPTATNAADATITVNGNTVTSGNDSAAINLPTPDVAVPIAIVVTAADTTTTMTYTVTATRAAATTGVNICSRTDQVEAAILAAITPSPACTSVTAMQLASITMLDLTGQSIATLLSGDFDGLTGLTELDLSGNNIDTLPADIFDGLTALETLFFFGNRGLTTLPTGIFADLTALTNLEVHDNGFTALPADIFDGLAALESLSLNFNQFTAGTGLPAGIFDDVIDRVTSVDDNGFVVDANVIAAHFVCSRSDFAAIVTATTGVTNCIRISSAQLDIYLATIDATLSGLTLSTGTLNPAFDSATTAYTVNVANSISSVTVTPTATNAGGATITVNGDTVTSGIASGTIDLPTPGTAVPITIIVTAADTTTMLTYTVTATSAAGPPTVSGVAFTSTGPYALGEAIEVTVTFSENVIVTGIPAIALTINGIPRAATYTSGSNSANLVFTYTVLAGETDGNGVGINANALTTPGSSTIQNAAGTDAVLTHDGVAQNLTHRVETVAPTLTGATVNGDSLVLTYNEALDPSSTPANDAYTIAVSGGGTPPTVTGTTISGAMATLTLSAAVTRGVTVTVSYTPDSTPLQDTAGNDAAALTTRSVTNDTPAPANMIYTDDDIPTTVNVGETFSVDFDINHPDASAIGNDRIWRRAVDSCGIVPGLTGAGLFTFTPGEALAGMTCNFAVTFFDTADTAIGNAFAFTVSINAADTPTATLVGTLTEATLFAATAPTVTVTLANTAYEAAPGTLMQSHFSVTDDVAGTVSVSGFTRDSNTEATLTLAYTTEDITADGMLSVTLDAAGHTGTGALMTDPIDITASAGMNICDRTPDVRDEIVSQSSADECTSVGDLATITRLNLNSFLSTALQSDDFAGLAGLTALDLGGNSLNTLPADIFADLSSLMTLDLSSNFFTMLPANIFAGLSLLETLELHTNLQLRQLSADIFTGLSSLRTLGLGNNTGLIAGNGLPAGIFDDVLDTLEAINPSGGSPVGFFIDDNVRDAHFVCSRDDADAIVAATADVTDCLRISSAQLNAALADATLSGLTLSAGALDPMFDSATTTYTVAVDNSVDTVTVMPTATNAGATIEVNGGSAADAIDLTAGPAVPITIVVTAADTTTTMTYTVTATRAAAGSTPNFDSALPLAPQIYTVGLDVGTVTLPAATGGNGELTYTLAPTLPAGLTFDPTSRVLSGTPTMLGETLLTYTVTDSMDTAEQTFTLIIVRGLSLSVVDSERYAVGQAFSLTLLAATGFAETETPTYTLTGPDGVSLPAGLTFDPTTRVLSGTQTMTGETQLTYTAADSVSTAEQTFTLTIVGLSLPMVGEERYEVGQAFRLILPEAENVIGTPTYTLTGPDAGPGNNDLPAGLSFFPDTRILSGTPTMTGTFLLTYRATDNQDTVDLFLTLIIDLIDQGGASLNALNEAILPEIARAMTDNTVNAITQRVERAAAGPAVTTVTLDGKTVSLTALAKSDTLAGALDDQSTGVASLLSGIARTATNKSWRLDRALGNSSFVMPMTSQNMISRLTLWGGGDYRNLSGETNTLDWDGDILSYRVGADAQVSDRVLAGVAVSWQSGEFDYADNTTSTTGRGAYEVEQTSVHPYLGWTAADGRLSLWATLGYGFGDVVLDDPDIDTQTSDLITRSVAVGGSGDLLQAGATTLRIKGQLQHTQVEVEGNTDLLRELTLDARRIRVALEGTHEYQFANGARLAPTVEVGLRQDGGDGRTGSGAEVGGGLRFTDTVHGLTVESRGRVLLAHSGNYQDWGVGGTIRFAPGQAGRGMAFSLVPSYGATASRVASLWAQELAVSPTANAASPTPRNGKMDVDLSYGLAWARADALITPYSRLSLTNTDTHAYRVGSRLQMQDGLAFNLEALRREAVTKPVEHGILLKLQLDW